MADFEVTGFQNVFVAGDREGLIPPSTRVYLADFADFAGQTVTAISIENVVPNVGSAAFFLGFDLDAVKITEGTQRTASLLETAPAVAPIVGTEAIFASPPPVTPFGLAPTSNYNEPTTALPISTLDSFDALNSADAPRGFLSTGDTGTITIRFAPTELPPDAKLYIGEVSDMGGERLDGAATARVTLTLEAEAPIALSDDTATTAPGTAVTIPVLADDEVPDGAVPVLARAPALGEARVQGAQIVYTPAPGFVGSQDFDYTVDGTDQTATVTVTVPAPVPVLDDDAGTTAPGVPVEIDVLDGDSGVFPLYQDIVIARAPEGGTAEVIGEGDAQRIRFTPAEGVTGETDFTYRIAGAPGEARGTVRVTVEGGTGENPLEQAKEVAYLYEAGLDRFPDLPGLNFWIDQRAGDLTELDLSDAFLDSEEFRGSVQAFLDLDDEVTKEDVRDESVLSDEDYVTLLYQNVLGRDFDQAGFDFWLGVLQIYESNPGQAPTARERLLINFAESGENRTQSVSIEGLALEDDGDSFSFAAQELAIRGVSVDTEAGTVAFEILAVDSLSVDDYEAAEPPRSFPEPVTVELAIRAEGGEETSFATLVFDELDAYEWVEIEESLPEDLAAGDYTVTARIFSPQVIEPTFRDEDGEVIDNNSDVSDSFLIA